MSCLSGTIIAISLKSCFKLSGRFDRPAYPGFIVTKIPTFVESFTCLSSSSILAFPSRKPVYREPKKKDKRQTRNQRIFSTHTRAEASSCCYYGKRPSARARRRVGRKEKKKDLTKYDPREVVLSELSEPEDTDSLSCHVSDQTWRMRTIVPSNAERRRESSSLLFERGGTKAGKKVSWTGAVASL